MFQPEKSSHGFDLFALNIQRGRDHGLAPYIQWREICNLPPVNDWLELEKEMRPSSFVVLKQIYQLIDRYRTITYLFNYFYMHTETLKILISTSESWPRILYRTVFSALWAAASLVTNSCAQKLAIVSGTRRATPSSVSHPVSFEKL